jgi:N-acetylmuramoyl-L-alanine amidase/uncharacterized protein YycO
MTLPVVVLDPGHGGTANVNGSSANNATGPAGTLEKTLTLDIAQRASAHLDGHANVILTRTTDTNLGLADRAEVARVNNAKVFIAIHLNGFSDPTVDGTETWVANGANDISETLALSLLGHLVPVTGVRDRGVRRGNLGVLLPNRHAAGTAACLAEIAFLTNASQETRLLDPAYLEQIAEAIARGARDSIAQASLTYSLGFREFFVDRLVTYFRNEFSRGIPLDPGVGGMSVGQDALESGDIIVSTTSQASSAIIRFGTGSQVSHAKLYIGDGQVVEAIGSGVELRSLADSVADDTVAVAFRYPGLTQDQKLRIRDFAGRQMGLPYNKLGVVRLAGFQIAAYDCDRLPGDLQDVCRRWVGQIVLGPGNSSTYFCSELLLGAYADAGISLTSTPPHWNSPQEIVDLSMTNSLSYVGHLKAPPAGSLSLGARDRSRSIDAPYDARALAAAIGGYGAPERRIGSAFDVTNLGYGVAGGVITDGFYRDPADKQAVYNQSGGRAQHLGIDVSLSNRHGGGAEDARRGLPVYAAIRRTIDISELNAARATRDKERIDSLGIAGSGTAELHDAVVLAQPWPGTNPMAYGGVAGFACHYRYPRADGGTGTFTLYVEYLHLITSAYLPKDGDGHLISPDAWAATGKPIGFGPRIATGTVLTADELTAGDPILVGYLGATQFPHVHVQVGYADGEQRYTRSIRVDPTVVVLAASTTSQALAAGFRALSLGGWPDEFDEDDAAAEAERQGVLVY